MQAAQSACPLHIVVTGIKPTYGSVSHHGAVPRTWSMDCIGSLAHSAKDCVLMLEVIAGADEHDSTTIDMKNDCWPSVKSDLTNIRIGIDQTLIDSTNIETRSAIKKALDVLPNTGFSI